MTNGPKIERIKFDSYLQSLIPTINLAHSKSDRDNISLGDLKALHYSENPALTTAARNNLEIFFEDVADEEEMDASLAQDIVQKLLTREQARAIAEACIEIINGERDDLGEVHRRVSETPSGTEDVLKPVTDDIEEIISEVESGVKWNFNIETLHKEVKGGGPGLFAVFAARPEVGKTAFWVSLAASPDGFVDQGALVHAIINEEPAIRTKLRGLSAASGKTFEEIKASIKEARENTKLVRDRLVLYDAVGITFSELQAHVEKYKPDILVIDQLDKVKVDGTFDKGVDRLREVYTQARELAKRNNIFVIGISQLSADGEGKLNTDYSMLENSKTGKAAEADLIICIGADNETKGWLRQLNLSKNKISGSHASVICTIRPEISRYVI